MMLKMHVHGAEPYELGDVPGYTLDEVIELEADNVISEANADHLEDNTDEARDELRKQVIADAQRRLNFVGDIYIDPIGVKWELIEGD